MTRAFLAFYAALSVMVTASLLLAFAYSAPGEVSASVRQVFRYLESIVGLYGLMLALPLFALVLLTFLVTMIWTGSGIDVGRQVLIGFDLLLVLVLGLLLYSISARDPLAPPGAFDALQLLLVVCALLVDAIALWAIAARITEFGFSPNKVAALGENLILLVNLGWSAVLYARFLKSRTSFDALERWQTGYLPVFAVWAWVVVAIFPILFDYR